MNIRDRLRHMIGKADQGWDTINERARAHLAYLAKLRESRAFRDDPVIAAEYKRTEQIVRDTARRADATR